MRPLLGHYAIHPAIDPIVSTYYSDILGSVANFVGI